jgi:hypothetical protein
MKDKVQKLYIQLRSACEKIKAFAIRVKIYIEQIDREDLYSAVSYIPFVGWLFSLYIMKDSPRCQENAKQGLFLSASVVIVLIFFYISRLFIIGFFKKAAFAIALTHMIFAIAYIAGSLFLIYSSYNKRDLKLPKISERAARLDI